MITLTIISVGFIFVSGTASTAAAAQGTWTEIGKTSSGNPVYVDARSVKTVKGITTARLQVRFVTPVQAGKVQWRASRHLAMFDCAKRTIANKSSTYYSDAAATKVVESKTTAQPGFGPALGGSMTQIAMDYICRR